MVRLSGTVSNWLDETVRHVKKRAVNHALLFCKLLIVNAKCALRHLAFFVHLYWHHLIQSKEDYHETC